MSALVPGFPAQAAPSMMSLMSVGSRENLHAWDRGQQQAVAAQRTMSPGRTPRSDDAPTTTLRRTLARTLSPSMPRVASSPGATLRLRDQLLSGVQPSTAILTPIATSPGAWAPYGGSARVAVATPPMGLGTARSSDSMIIGEAWRNDLEAMQFQIQKVRDKHDTQAAQTEAALVEVCKSLGMQQQQLEHQEMCTGMIHQLLQEYIPGAALGENGDTVIPDHIKKTFNTGMRTSVEQLASRQEVVENSLMALQRGVAVLQQQLAGVAGIVEPACPNKARTDTMASLEAANSALGDLLAEIAPTATSVGSSPDSPSHGDSISDRMLVPLRVELEMLCKDAHEGLEQRLREDVQVLKTGQAELKAALAVDLQSLLHGKQATMDDLASNLRKEQQDGLTHLAIALREEVEAVRGQSTATAMSCWEDLQQKESKEGKEGKDDSQSMREELEVLREEFGSAFQQRLQKSLEVLAAAQDQQSEEWSTRLEHLRTDMKESANSELAIKHKELCYLVHVQQNMLSQHTEELETLRHEQHNGLNSVTSSMRQKIDAVSELSRVLQHRVDSACSQEAGSQQAQGPLWSHVADSLTTVHRQPDAHPSDGNAVRVLREELDSISGAAGSMQKELDTACRRANSNTRSSCWPMMHKKLSDLTDTVNDIDKSHRPDIIWDALADRQDVWTEPPFVGAAASSMDAPQVLGNRQSSHLVAQSVALANTSMQAELNHLSGLTQDLRDHFGRGPKAASSATRFGPPGQQVEVGMAQTLLRQQLDTAQGQVNSSAGGGSWKDLKEELCCAAEVLHNVCEEPSALEAYMANASATATPVASTPVAPEAEVRTPVEARGLQMKLESVLQTFQHAAVLQATPLGRAGSVQSSQEQLAGTVDSAVPPLDVQTAWWKDLQDRHPDLAQLVQTQRTELTRIVGSQNFAVAVPPCEP